MISQNGDKLKKQAGSEVQNHVQTREQSAQQNSIVGRDAESGTGQNIFDEQERDSAQDDHGTKAVDNYQTKEFRTGRENIFAMTAIDRDHNGRIDYTALLISPEAVCREYQYDLGGRLCKVICGNDIVEQYTYGKYGERLTDVTGKAKPRKFVYNDKLQLIQAGEVKYSYNSNGRLSMKMDMGDVTTYYYTESGILNEVRLPNMRKIQYIIDPLGRRVVKKINGITIESYLWDGMTTLVAVCDGQGMNHKAFTYNEEGDPVTMTYQDKTYNLATDQVGTIFMVADERGNEIKEIIHDSFGNKAFDSNEEFDTKIGFAAGLLDKDTGLVHFGYRDYDPTIGRFTTPDPIGLAGGDVDVYGYCLDDPINFHDRTGLAGQSQESKDELAETVINELITTKAPSVTASEEYKKGNVEGSGISKSGKPAKGTKHAGADSVKRPSENKTVKHAGADKIDRPPKNKTTKHAGADRNGVPSRHDKKAGADNSSMAPTKKGSKLTLQDLGDAAWNGATKGAAPGAIYGSALGPLGAVAGGVTGAAVGASIGMLYEVGSTAISDTLGIDKDTQKRLREEMGKINSKNKRRKN